MTSFDIHTLETPAEMEQVEELQRQVWPGSETDIVPSHLLLTIAHNGGLVLGAYVNGQLAGFVMGFAGLYDVPDGPRPKHCSHQMGVLPAHRDSGIGFALKQAQWQMVRKQGLDRITWTYDPLLSRNGFLNIARLGAVCNTYLREVYGDMRDGLNAGLPSDRFQVDLWVNTQRVERRLGKRPRGELSMEQVQLADTPIWNKALINKAGFAVPADALPELEGRVGLIEIPSDFLKLKAADFELALAWRLHSRALLEKAFNQGYLVTDFIFEKAAQPRSYYLLSHGESTV